MLFFGADSGLARERAETLARRIVPDAEDPFRIARLGEPDLKADPARLPDELAAVAMLGGKRLVELRGAGDGLAKLIEGVLGDLAAGTLKADALLVVEAGDLTPKSALRKAFEEASNAAAIACEAQGEADTLTLVERWAEAEGLAIEPEAKALLTELLLGDRARARGELEKLALHALSAEGPEPVGEGAVRALVSGGTDADQFALAGRAAAGEPRTLELALGDQVLEEVSPIGLLRITAEQLKRILWVRTRLDEGARGAEAAKGLRPPAFGPREAQLRRQAAGWTGPRLRMGLAWLVEAEANAKLQSANEEAIAARALVRVARLGAVGR